jgi:hypothetical protein
MTLMDEPFLDTTRTPVTISAISPSHGSNPRGPRVSVVFPAAPEGYVDSMLDRLPASVDEVILAGGGGDQVLRAGLAAAHGDCIVFIDPAGNVEAEAIERFAGALKSGAKTSDHPAQL